MSKESYESHKPFAKEKKPSMKRRAPENDYCSRRMYMITLNVEGRQPLLGSVEGHSDQPADSPDAPHLVPTPLGEAVSRCWRDISHYHPEVEVIALQLMPDHLHGILFVREQMPVPLGKVVLGFKQGCNKAFRQLSASLPYPEVEYAAVIQRQTGPDAEGQTGPRAEGQTAPSAEGHHAGCRGGRSARHHLSRERFDTLYQTHRTQHGDMCRRQAPHPCPVATPQRTAHHPPRPVPRAQHHGTYHLPEIGTVR